MRVGLTGGVGSGKSTVSALLAQHGATVFDADAIAREVVEPGTVGFDAVVAHFGSGVVAADGSLDRAALAALVFNDDEARNALNAIVHPLVGQRFAEQMASAPPDAIVVYDVPLLVEGGLEKGFDIVVVVETDPETRVARLAGRGMPEQDARARMAAQATDAERRAAAHEVIRNDGTPEALETEVDELWRRLLERQHVQAEPSSP
jgi:dephospho-CoA kinase